MDNEKVFAMSFAKVYPMLIAKAERDGRTYTSVTPLDYEGRAREVARIIGGSQITETTLQSAREMLQ